MSEWIARNVLRRWGSVSKLAHLPLVGPCVRKAGKLLMPEKALVWMQVKSGPACGLWIELNPRTGKAFYEGDAEPSVQQYLAERVTPGMIVYDLGANCGFFSLICARKAGEKGRIYCFEPEHELAERVRRNMRRNGFEHFLVTEAAVWGRSGFVCFQRSDTTISPDRGTGFVTRADGPGLAAVQVPSISLDDFVLTSEPPDLIKCDVEGAEAEVLSGAAKLFASQSPILVCEIHTEEADGKVRAQLQKWGYDVKNLDANHIAAERQA